MLKSIRSENFQNCKDSFAELSEGVNIASGDSDSGKSALFSRSPNLVINNRPSGYGYKPWHSKKGVESKVTMIFDNGSVIRTKSNKTDSYILQLDGQEPQLFESLNRKVPDEVKEFLNLENYNFQEQEPKTRHFFISESPSERARALNDITGLSIIDSSLASVNKLIRDNDGEIKRLEKDIVDKTESIDKIAFVDKADTMLVQLETMFGESERLESVNKDLSNYVDELSEVHKIIERASVIVGAKQKYSEIKEAIAKSSEIADKINVLTNYVENVSSLTEVISDNKEFLESKPILKDLNQQIFDCQELALSIKELQSYVDSLIEVEEVIESTSDWLKCKERLNMLNEEIDRYELLGYDVEEIEEWIESAENIDNRILLLTKRVKDAKVEKKEFLKSLGKCPLCNGKIK